MQQSADMIKDIYSVFNKPILVVADSWFGNNGLWKCFDKGQNGNFNILSRLRANNNLFDFHKTTAINSRGRPKTYGSKLGSMLECAELYKDKAAPVRVFFMEKSVRFWFIQEI